MSSASSQFRTHYDNLQVTKNANEAVIRAAYRTLSQKYHPDKNPDDSELAHRRMKLINQAYEVLSDPIRRAEHDAWIKSKEDEFREAEEALKNNAYSYHQQNTERKEANSTEQPKYSANDKDVKQGKAQFKEGAAKPNTAQQTHQASKTRWTKNAFWLGLFVSLVAFMALEKGRSFGEDSQLKEAEHMANSIAPTRPVPAIAPTPVAPAIVSSPLALTANVQQSEKQSYDIALMELEKKYPELNPKSPDFHIGMVKNVLEIKKSYVGQGYTHVNALRYAAALYGYK